MKNKTDLALAWAVKARAKGIKMRPVVDELLDEVPEENMPTEEHPDEAVEAAPVQNKLTAIIRKIRAGKVHNEDRELEGLESDN
jgi:hypothetical protein